MICLTYFYFPKKNFQKMSTAVYDSLAVRTPVVVQCKFKPCKYDGTVKSVNFSYINKAAKHFGKERDVYISFIDDKKAYRELLMRGSKLMCFVNNTLMHCYIDTILHDNSGNIARLIVAEEEEETFRPFPTTFTVPFENIDSILITSKAYDVARL